MSWFPTFVRLAAASMIAAAAAGLLVLPLAALAGVAEWLAGGGSAWGAAELGPLVAMILFLNWLIVAPAIIFGTIPTLITCGAVWAAGRRHAWARHARAYAGTGAVTAAALGTWAFAQAASGHLPDPTVLLLFATSGTGGGLMFRSAMGASGELAEE